MDFNQFLGIEVRARHDDGMTIRVALRPELMNIAGVAHGGVTATMADAAAGMGLMHLLGGRRAVTTTELKINYLLPVTGAWLEARAKFVRRGRTLAVAQVELTDDQSRLVAIALVTYMILPDAQ
ncbi:MAG: PaaI family thioesterase [Bryobacterales bacterium]|nr:PaaI family thioesterase [Bryobacterales bacterium]